MRNAIFDIGDIVIDKENKFYYLILKKARHEDDMYYVVIDLQRGDKTTIGYWDYILPSKWEKAV